MEAAMRVNAPFRTGCKAAISARPDLKKSDSLPCQGHKEVPARVNLLLSTGLALSISLGAILPPAVQAEDSVQKRREDMERRKELLAKTRAKALASGGQQSLGGEAEPQTALESSAAPSVSSNDEQKIKADTDEVTRSNAEREREAEKMRMNMKSSLQSYEASSQKKDQSFKPGKPAADPSLESPSWLKSFIEDNQKKGSPEAATTPPLPPPTPSPRSEASPSLSAPASKSSPSPSASMKDTAEGSRLASSPAVDPPKATPPPPLPKPSSGPSIPTPKPATKPKLGVQPLQKQAGKPQKAVEAKRGKQRGPLPMTVAQLLMLAVFGGIGYATFYKEEELNLVLAKVGTVIAGAYSKIDKSSAKAGKAKSS